MQRRSLAGQMAAMRGEKVRSVRYDDDDGSSGTEAEGAEEEEAEESGWD